MKTTVEGHLGRVASTVIGLVLVATALGAMVWPHDPNLVYNRWLVPVGFLVSVGLAWGLTLAGTRLPRGRRATAVVAGVAVAASVGGAVASFWLADHVVYVYGWDARGLTNITERLSRTGVLTPYAEAYFSRFPNNVPLVAIMRLCRDVGLAHGVDMYTVYRALNAACVGATLLLTFALVRMLRGPWAGVAAQGVVFVLVGASPWIAVPYTDVPALPLVIGGVTCLVAAVRTKRVWVGAPLFIAGGGVLGLAYVVKSTPGALAAGVAAALVVAVCRWSGARAWCTLVAGALLAAGAFAGTATVATHAAYAVSGVPRERLDSTRVPPPTWWMALGLIAAKRPVGGVVYGGYNSAMVRQSRYLRGDELRDWSEQRLRARVDQLGVSGLARFEVDKQLFNWGDGMFYAWGEGHDADPARLLDVSEGARVVQSWNHAEGSHYVSRASLTNGLWLALVFWAGAGLLLSPYRREVLMLALGLAAVTVLLLLFQGRSRYLFAYAPLVVALAASADVPGRAGSLGSRVRFPRRPRGSPVPASTQ